MRTRRNSLPVRWHSILIEKGLLSIPSTEVSALSKLLYGFIIDKPEKNGRVNVESTVLAHELGTTARAIEIAMTGLMRLDLIGYRKTKGEGKRAYKYAVEFYETDLIMKE